MYLAFMSMFNFLNDLHVAMPTTPYLVSCVCDCHVLLCTEQLDEFLVTGFANYLPFDITCCNFLK